MGKKRRIAIVGCGGMGGGHAIAIGSGTGNAVWGADSSSDLDPNVELHRAFDSDISKKLELAGVYDTNPERMKWADERDFHSYGSFEEILQDESVDIVLIATPNDSHKSLAISAMKAGKHVLCEKPVMMTSRELEEVMQVSKETGMVFYPRQNREWDRDFIIVKKIFEEQLIGKVTRIESRVHGSRGIPSDWRAKAEFGGGMMMDWGVHLLDRILVMVPQKVTSVYCRLTNITNEECDDGFTIILTFESGLTALVEVGTCNFIPLPLWYVTGTEGAAQIDNWKCEGKMVRLSSWEDKDAKPIQAGAGLTKTMAPRDNNSLQNIGLPEVNIDNNELYSNLVDVVNGEAEQIVSQEHALRVLKLMEAAVESSKTGKVIEFEK